jgi:hypothetical protein
VNHREPNREILSPKGVKAAVAARSRARRECQRALTDAHAPARPHNGLVPQITLVVAPTEFARLVLTDPPCNVPNFGHVTSDGRHREFAVANGEMSAEEYGAFNRDWMSTTALCLVDGGLIGPFLDRRSIGLMLACGRQLGLALINLVLRAKSNGGQEGLWRSQHELLSETASEGDDADSNGEEGDDHEQA